MPISSLNSSLRQSLRHFFRSLEREKRAPKKTPKRDPAIGMPLFFTLSGFIIHYVYADAFASGWRRAGGEFAIARFSRIYPLYLALLVYSLLSLEWTPRLDIAGPIWVSSGPYLLTFVVLVPLVLHETEDFRAALSWLIVVGGILVFVLLVFGTWGLRGLSLGAHSAEQETNPLALAGLGGSVAAAAMLLHPQRAKPLLQSEVFKC